ncbi:L-threonylcarbamoyladenylate synthase [Candidatus Vallotia tarda]|uniref:Threonylcarbamoyl-AMP synthase n=1 Tax=Candidatus Vallotiella hemipterorum TaxID=1177213 RepID=A0A916NUH0_9BURK|nr:L-threonylcarbamoyladenylate synthase [Candidatus Vallotia tarda]CAG7597445.1 Threonylcarbamoyl-AMP synthase [Candidatus Vallotia tarda]
MSDIRRYSDGCHTLPLTSTNSNAPKYYTLATIDAAVCRLDAGELVAFPTETVYGLGADACNLQAVARIYEVKNRPATHPVIVHLASGDDPGRWVLSISLEAQRLIDAFWPGPLTLILKRAATITNAVSGGQDSIGLRCPSHPVAQALLRAFSDLRHGHSSIAAPSANKFGYVSPTIAQHVRDAFGDSIYLLDGGACDIGIESTIVDLSRGFPSLLRPGRITQQQITDVLGIAPQLPSNSSIATAPRSSGTLKAHYAPHTPISLLPIEDILNTVESYSSHKRLAVIASNSLPQADVLRGRPNLEFLIAPNNPYTYEYKLYRMLRQLDSLNVLRIFIELLPSTSEWTVVNDRLQRAEAAFKSDGPILISSPNT